MSGQMELGISERVGTLREKVSEMIKNEIIPLDDEYLAEVNIGERWHHTERQTEILEGLKSKA